MVLSTTTPPYRLERRTMADLLFGPATARVAWPTAVSDCAERQRTPASAAHVWAFRLEADGEDHAHEHFATSTAVIAFHADSQYQIALYDTQQHDGRDNLLIARAQEAYDAHRDHKAWLVSRKDATLKGMLKEAEHRDRIITPGGRTLPLDGTYARDQSTKAILGDHDLALAVQTFLRDNRFTHGHHWLCSHQELDRMGVNDEHAEVRRMAVGGTYLMQCMGASPLSIHGRARGVQNARS